MLGVGTQVCSYDLQGQKVGLSVCMHCILTMMGSGEQELEAEGESEQPGNGH